ncbi:hypothetical protein GCM10011492_26720 [Flexivirga endophytica]|uniref:N-acetyltransferase domain-containing protein n=1 Tax=Flexivirga endophytica TaxID=1849103 RepID=A0A916WW68_9MICO|nr:GNAT family N-acetyltransferase [Flexivirga endophytica]GGB34708.1 hypothetical protein GCM10011492_26720 [Flexivirga endophytica]GHB42625.1 hypothetical protein GCM10008112_09100 [Flexivirga endophytica]
MRPATVRIRPFRATDGTAVRALFDRWSDQSTYYRFLSVSRSPAVGYVDALGDPERTMYAVVATGDTGKVIGVGSLHRAAHNSAEFGLAVDDSAQGHGVGTRLLAALLRNARQQQLAVLNAYVEPGNHRMLELVTDELPDATRELRDGVITVTVPVNAAVHHWSTHVNAEV